jgi:hypothetical protein
MTDITSASRPTPQASRREGRRFAIVSAIFAFFLRAFFAFFARLR